MGCAEFGEPKAPELTEKEVATMTCDILEKVLNVEGVNPLEILLQVHEVNLVRQKVIEMKESKFYADNMGMRKGVHNMKKVPKERGKSKDELAAIYSA